MVDDVGAVDRRVHGGEFLQCMHRSLDEKGHERQLGLVALFKFILRLSAQDGHLSHVDFVDRIDVRGNALRRHHVLGDSLPHGAHRLDFVIAEVNLFPRHRGFERDVGLRTGSPGRALSRQKSADEERAPAARVWAREH